MIEETYKYLLKEYEIILLKPLVEKTYKNMLIEELRHILTVMKEANLLMQTIMSQGQMSSFDIPKCTKTAMAEMKEKLDDRFKMIFSQGMIENEITSISSHPYLRHLIQALMTGLMIQFVHQEIDITEDDLLELIYEQIQQLIKA